MKVTGAFAYSSDLSWDRMLFGATLRSPHPHARIRNIDTSQALAVPGVRAVLTHEDVPGRKTYGMHVVDQPVLAWDTVRYQGEAVALVAADHPEIARRAIDRIRIDYEPLQPLTDPEQTLKGSAPLVHPSGNIVRHVKIRHGDIDKARPLADVMVKGDYQVGMQDQAFLGPESGLAVPTEDGGIELYVSSQWLHEDQEQVAASLGLPSDKVHLTLAGVGGAFGGREDLSVQIHVCMLALHTDRPVKMVYGREESFFGHVHRHPARMLFEHGATNDGKLLYVRARLLLDGGAYTSTSQAVIANACYFAAGAYEVPNVAIDGFAVYTNNPPCGAMRGFGTVQSCFGVESNMDKLARALNIHPIKLRLVNAMASGSTLPTGQKVDGPARVSELLRHLEMIPLPERVRKNGGFELSELPGGFGNVTHGERVRRGIGYAVGMKAIGYSGGVDDYSTARVRLSSPGGELLVEVHSAAAECGQGIVAVQAQIARTELGIENVIVHPADTSVGDAGSSSASRQTWMTGGAVQGACRALRERLIDRAAAILRASPVDLTLTEGEVAFVGMGEIAIPIVELLGNEIIEETYEYHHGSTEPLNPLTGQGRAHVAFAFAAQRAVVDVDTELGLVRVVEMAIAEDVGKAINPLAVEGQIEGGIAQGLGLALLEEIQLLDGKVMNPSFTDYLIPTILDMPPVKIDLLQTPHPDSPYGVNGVGELSTLSSTPAIVNALRDATGLDLRRVPVHPDDITGLRG